MRKFLVVLAGIGVVVTVAGCDGDGGGDEGDAGTRPDARAGSDSGGGGDAAIPEDGAVPDDGAIEDDGAVGGDGAIDFDGGTGRCGDGTPSATEACDDGNERDGDGCSARCAIESGWECDDSVPSVCGAICGDGTLAGGEACDDGNEVDGDGCSSACLIEPGFDCTGTPSACSAACGDGVRASVEGCDDQNTTSGDGCADNCTVETGFTCAGMPSVCTTACGDGIVAGTEACDDMNTIDGDGCSMSCALEPGFTCSGAPSVCATTCGDAIVAGTETCDDMNTIDGDGCSMSCAIEPGFTCSGAPSVCATTCGDGIAAGAETCDDMNTIDGDGCSMSCAAEPGFTCSGSPSVCATTCGDGIVAGAETCDDGNGTGNDCCSATCQPEMLITIDGGARTAMCELEPNGDAATAASGRIFAPGYLAGGIRPVADYDYFPIVLTATSDLRIATFGPGTSTTCPATTVFDTLIELRGPDGTSVLARDDDDGPNFCSDIDATRDAGARGLPPGTYYVVVHEYQDDAAIPLYTVVVTATATCGDGVVSGSETCDDANTTAGDGCGATCRAETGYSCTGAPSACTPICGDGLVLAVEACDDGNTAAFDGCGPTCAIEGGFSCSGAPSACVAATETFCSGGRDDDGDGSADCADSDCALACSLTACGAGETLAQWISTDVPRSLPDSPAVSNSVLAVPLAATVQRTAVRFSATHTFDGDLRISLISPAGTSVVLSNRRGGGGDNWAGTTFDDACATAIASGVAPFAGCFRPESPLAAYNGQSVSGTWTWRSADLAGADVGTLTAWSIAACITP